MTIALFLTVIAAIAGAISAAARTYTKLKPQVVPSYPKTVQEAKSLEAEQPRLQPDLDSERPELVEVSSEVTSAIALPQEASESMEASVQPKHFESSTIAIPPMMPIAESEISLATSLRISDVVDSDLAVEAKSEEPHHYSVIEEVDQLNRIDQKLDQLQHQATDSDHLMRLAAAVELGDLVKQGQVNDRVIALLNQLTQDADSEVCVQAGSSLAMISVETAD